MPNSIFFFQIEFFKNKMLLISYVSITYTPTPPLSAKISKSANPLPLRPLTHEADADAYADAGDV